MVVANFLITDALWILIIVPNLCSRVGLFLYSKTDPRQQKKHLMTSHEESFLFEKNNFHRISIKKIIPYYIELHVLSLHLQRMQTNKTKTYVLDSLPFLIRLIHWFIQDGRFLKLWNNQSLCASLGFGLYTWNASYKRVTKKKFTGKFHNQRHTRTFLFSPYTFNVP